MIDSKYMKELTELIYFSRLDRKDVIHKVKVISDSRGEEVLEYILADIKQYNEPITHIMFHEITPCNFFLIYLIKHNLLESWLEERYTFKQSKKHFTINFCHFGNIDIKHSFVFARKVNKNINWHKVYIDYEKEKNNFFHQKKE